MARQSLAYDQAHNPTQLSAELRAAGIDAQVSDEGVNRFWVNAASDVDPDDIAAVIADHVPETGSAVASDVAADSIVTGTFEFSNGLKIVSLSTAITANSTTTTAPAGSIGITSHATGVGKLFISDGTKWQFAVVA
jgi:hypothetical protein